MPAVIPFYMPKQWEYPLLDSDADADLEALGRVGQWKPYPRVVHHEQKCIPGHCMRCDKPRDRKGLLCKVCHIVEVQRVRRQQTRGAKKRFNERGRYVERNAVGVNRQAGIRTTEWAIDEVKRFIMLWEAEPDSVRRSQQLQMYQWELRVHENTLKRLRGSQA